MKNIYQDDSFALHTDTYRIDMVETYWRDGRYNKRAVFELFFRKLPFGNGYAVFAGLEKVIQFIQAFRFSNDDLEYLKNEVKFTRMTF